MKVHSDIFCMHACKRGYVRKKRECYLRAKEKGVIHRKERSTENNYYAL